MPRAEREQRILAVAGTVFARDGYHAASMDEIAAAAEISKPMLYQYFGSKEGLYVAYIGQSGRELIERLEQVLGTDDPSPARLRSRVDAFLGFVEENRDGWRVLWGEANSSRPVAEETRHLRAQLSDAVAAIIAAGPAGPLLEPAAVHAASQSIVGSGEALANWWLGRPDVPRQQVSEWYSRIVQATVMALLPARDRPPG